MRVLIVGCGYVGLETGRRLAAEGHEVFGLRRSDGAQQALREAGIQWLQADVLDPASLKALPGAFDWVVNVVSAGRAGPDTYRAVYLEGTHNLLRWLDPHPPQRFVYTSSSGVYAQNDGSWVDELSPTEPSEPTGRILVETESALLQAARERAFPTVILRPSGIYGPDRGYWLRQFLSGEARLEGDGSRFLNMIHRDDLAEIIIAALASGRTGEIFNATDDEPVRQRDLFAWLAAVMNRSIPESASQTDSVGRRGVTNKRVSNDKLKRELTLRFNYPTFREGYSRELQRLGATANEGE